PAILLERARRDPANPLDHLEHADRHTLGKRRAPHVVLQLDAPNELVVRAQLTHLNGRATAPVHASGESRECPPCCRGSADRCTWPPAPIDGCFPWPP